MPITLQYNNAAIKERSVCRYGTVSIVENATGTVPYSQRKRNGIR